MRIEADLVVVGVALIVTAGVLARRRIRRLRRDEVFLGDNRSTARTTALVIGALCAIVLVSTVTALGLR